VVVLQHDRPAELANGRSGQGIWPNQAGEFIVHVPETRLAAGPPVLEVAVDGESLLSWELRLPKDESWALWQRFAVPVAAGQHRISVRNVGKGALWTGFELTHYQLREGPNLDVFGMQSRDTILLWLRHPRFTWIHRREGLKPDPQPAGLLALDGVANGTYKVTWVNTLSGNTDPAQRVTASDGILHLRTPPISASTAARLEFLGP